MAYISNISVSDVAQDGLSQVSWVFSLIDTRLVLQDYLVEQRASTRHKFKVDYDRSWSMHDPRRYGITKSDIPIPDDLVARAKDAMVEALLLRVTVDLPQKDVAPKQSGTTSKINL